MRRLLAKRLAQFVPVIFGVSFLSYVMVNLLPGDTAIAILGTNATPQALAVLRRELHLNQPLLERHWTWLTTALHGNLGHSLITSQQVSTVIIQRLPVTAELIFLGLLLALLMAIPMAAMAAFRLQSLFDKVTRAIAMSAISTPGFILGILLIFVFTVKVHFFPSLGFKPLSAGLWPNLKTMILPAVTLGVGLFANYARILRADMAEQLINEDYVTMARAKGVSERRLMLKHVLRNSLFGLITVVGLNMGTLIGGTVIVETVFALPGIGQDLVQSINNRDATVVQAIVLLFAFTVVFANLVTDILYTVIDPRVRYGRI